jgi:hypothetical protein
MKNHFNNHNPIVKASRDESFAKVGGRYVQDQHHDNEIIFSPILLTLAFEQLRKTVFSREHSE